MSSSLRRLRANRRNAQKSTGLKKLNWQWHPDICQASRKDQIGKPETRPYPPQRRETINGVTVSIQDTPERAH